ncbi:hypothetical protein ACFVT5_02915 [Streptomyces sp. NPDC058001]|uniref:hypothetical protein n=1 Tax=Streptomyces sp. NPDC058001 TaxID=3346300 RepID=UPI0036EAF213
MEQPIGKNPSLVDAAALDPAHVPGLVTSSAGVTAAKAPAPKAQETERSEPEPTEPEVPAEPDEPVAETDVPESEPETDAEPEADADTDAESGKAVDGDDDADDEGTADADADADDPVFAVSDRRGSITVDRDGVRFELDDQTAEWRWDEIGAVEYETPRFGKRFTVLVHTPDRRWYPNEVEAPARSDLKEWTARLDKALDAWFEDE